MPMRCKSPLCVHSVFRLHSIYPVEWCMQLFCDEARPEMKESNPEAKFGELNALLAAKWKAVSDADKERFKKAHQVRQI